MTGHHALGTHSSSQRIFVSLVGAMLHLPVHILAGL